ncbi:sulfite exporter TauE/SafE family protein [Algoriphagus boritolerans]|uniref:Probable membrane transporter protein n=2 Tax=Algoriphagus TaxID=246875 RepID=A0A1H6A1F5_9BACT|nr:sulfite exporter TauE/SafE family protein [Algoriphagus boritolerans]SEG42593.1 Sulfite exporter TauE/SafE [Algoriphagus boritolerans DSM 17298 = JCM 18970]
MSIILKLILGVITGIFGYYYITDVFRNRKTFSGKPWSGLLGTGFITNFFDTLGIGSFAQQTAIFKFFKLVDDRLIPGTMNVGNTIPVVIQAFIFMTVVEVDTLTLVSMSIVAPLGALLGADIVSKMSRSRIQIGLGFGLLAVGLIMIAGFFNLMPTGGEAIGLTGWKLAVILVMSFIFGALQTIGVGFYAPCMAMVYALGMHPLTAFPIMMTATAMLMAAGGARFVKQNAYDRKVSFSLTIAGVIGVFLAAYVVKSLPLLILRWVVLGVVLYTSGWMFRSASRKEQESKIIVV